MKKFLLVAVVLVGLTTTTTFYNAASNWNYGSSATKVWSKYYQDTNRKGHWARVKNIDGGAGNSYDEASKGYTAEAIAGQYKGDQVASRGMKS